MTPNKNSYVELIITHPNSYLKEINKYNNKQYSYAFRYSSDDRTIGKTSYNYINSNLYTYAFKYSSNHLPLPFHKPTQPPTYSKSDVITKSPTNTSLQNIKLDICENSCNQCIQQYKYAIGFISSFLGLLLFYIFLKKINYKNILKKYIYNNHKKSNTRKNLNSAFKNQVLHPLGDIRLEYIDLEEFGITNYNSEFSEILN